MATSCVLIPKVKNPKGELVDSKLFQDLASYTSKRSNAVYLWGLTRTEKFQFEYGDRLSYDKNGEPTLDSLIKNVNIKGLMDDFTTISKVSKDLGITNKKGETVFVEDTTANYLSLIGKAVDFNKNSNLKDKFCLVPTVVNGKIGLVLEVSTDSSRELAKKTEISFYLNNKIREILRNSNIEISSINSLQDRLHANGALNYETASLTARGIVDLILLAEGSKGEQALPEEFAHLVVDLMRDDALIKRLFSLLESQDIVKTILGDEYDSYREKYNNNLDRLQREAAGKLVYRGFFNKEEVLPSHKSFIQKIIDSIKNFIKSTFSKQDFINALDEAQKIANQISNVAITSGALKLESIEDLKKFENLFQLRNQPISLGTFIQKSLDIELKKFEIYSKKLNTQIRAAKTVDEKTKLQDKLLEFTHTVERFRESQLEALNKGTFNVGVATFINHSSKEIELIVKKLHNLINGDHIPLSVKASEIQDIKNFIYSVKLSKEDLDSILENGDIQLNSSLEEAYYKLGHNLDKATNLFNNQCIEIFANFLNQYMNSDSVNMSSTEKKTINREDLIQLLKTADHDISFMDTWFQSLADCDDIILKLSDQAMKVAKEQHRFRAMAVRDRLMTAASKYTAETGSNDFSFLYEKNSDSSLSTRYISEINWTQFFENRDKLFNDIKGLSKVKRRQEILAWKKANIDSNTGYPNSNYQVNLEKVLTAAQKEFYDEFIAVREECINLLPSRYESLVNDPMKAVQIRKDLWERVKSSSPDTWLQQLYEDGKSKIVTKVDDTSFGNTQGIRDFNNEEIMSVPIFFLNDVDTNELSRDAVSTMIAFADMAINYDELSKVQSYFEIGKDIMEKRTARAMKGNRRLSETVGRGESRQQNPIYVKATNINTAYKEFIESQLYHRYLKDTVMYTTKNGDEVTYNKLAGVLNGISSLNQLALNALAGIAAVSSDMAVVNGEALAGQFFTAKELFNADKIYFKEIGKVIGEYASPIKTTKLALFLQKFDVNHDYSDKIRDTKWDQSKFKKMFNLNALYVFMNSGAHWGEGRTAIAQALHTQVTSKDGTQTKSLWDVLKVQYVDESNPALGAKLVVDDNFEVSDKELIEFGNKCTKLNTRLFGNYNNMNRTAIQRTALGQLCLLYRKFLIPAINRRWGKGTYDFDLNMETEGYYRTLFNFLKDVLSDSKHLITAYKMYKNEMTDTQKQNCLRALNEVGIFTLLVVLSTLTDDWDWDKKDNPWAQRLIAYMSKRVKTEVGAFSPFGITKELWDIIKSPAAAINTLESFSNLTDLLNVGNYFGDDAIVTRGRYKGKTKAYKAWMSSPLVPMNRTIYKIFHPEEALIVYR